MHKFDIYLATIYFHEQDGRSKNRPVVILNQGVTLEVAPITGTLTGNKYILQDWKEENLAKPSAVYLPIHEVDLKQDLRAISKSGDGIKIGSLTERDIQGLLNFLRKNKISC